MRAKNFKIRLWISDATSEDSFFCGDEAIKELKKHVGNPNVIIELYSGIKDIDKEEIYEHDIIEQGEDKYIVFFYSSSFYLCVLQAWKKDFSKKHSFPHLDDFVRKHRGRVKVIGNIHEDKNLLREVLEKEREMEDSE